MTDRSEHVFCAAVFNDIASAERAVSKLLAAGFTRDEVSVLCSEKTAGDHFGDVKESSATDDESPDAVGAGASIGAILGGAIFAGVATTAGLPIVLVGAGLAIGGAVGTFAGLMSERGFEHELADFYDQALTAGQVLVAVREQNEQARKKAEGIFEECGAEPIALAGA